MTKLGDVVDLSGRHDSVRDTVARAIEDGRVLGLDAAIDAATFLGYSDFIPVLTILRDWPRAGGFRQRQERSMEGTIARLVTEKGFGFIKGDDGVERFFHSSSVRGGNRFDQLREGQVVSFDVGQGPKGPRAENVNVV